MKNHKFVLKHLWIDNGLVCANEAGYGLIVVCPEDVFFNGNTDSLRKNWIDLENGIRYRKIPTTKSCYLQDSPDTYKRLLLSQPSLNTWVHDSFKRLCNSIKIYYDFVITKQEFDSSGNLVFDCPGRAYFRKMEYNSGGLCIYDEITWQPERVNRASKVFWERHEYDSYGICIRTTNSHGQWEVSTRNDDGSYSVLNDTGLKSTYMYDASGNVTSITSSDGTWAKYEYDARGNITFYENSHGFYSAFAYDSNNKLIDTDYQKIVL